MFIACPHCGVQLQNNPATAGQIVSCPQCSGKFQMPVQVIPAAQFYTPSQPLPGHNAVPAGISVPLLISAISNVVMALVWLSMCFTAPLSVAMVVLCVFEFRLYARIGRDPLEAIAREASSLSVWQIVVGIFNTASLICGIILMINAGKYRTPQRISTTPTPPPVIAPPRQG